MTFDQVLEYAPYAGSAVVGAMYQAYVQPYVTRAFRAVKAAVASWRS